MGFWDFLKGILPEKLINIDNRKIIINNSSVVIGEQKINDPKIVDKIFDKLSEYQTKESLPCQVIHKDLENSYTEYEDLSIEQNESIKKLKLVLPSEEVECILMARRIKLAYDKQNMELAKELHKQLDKNYPKKGYKVFNLIGGGYFDEMIIPFIEIFKDPEEYRKFYQDIIRFFPLAFFVGNTTTEEKLVEGLEERLNLKDVPFVRIHAIGRNNIKKVENVVEKLKIEEKFSTKDNRFASPSGLKAQIFEISTKEKKSEEVSED